MAAFYFFAWATGSALGVPSGSSGFEIGNGGRIHSDGQGIYSLRMFEDIEIDQEKPTRILAPRSDGSSPWRTQLSIASFPTVWSDEEAFQSLRIGYKGWIEFSLKRLLGFYREVAVREWWNRLEMQLFRRNERLVIRLEGNKTKSAAYRRLAESLLEEIE